MYSMMYIYHGLKSKQLIIYKRAKHVLSESLRVLHFRICLDASSSSSTSVPQLALEAGAYGSRLIGAGWGGCIVSLAAEDKVESFIGQLKENYPPYRKLTEGSSLRLFLPLSRAVACGMHNPSPLVQKWFACNDDNVLTLEWVTKEYNSNAVERAISLARRTRETQREETRTLSAASFIHEALKDTN
ncbi:hypothetical protein JOM56_014006 [Amanita muscaria]